MGTTSNTLFTGSSRFSADFQAVVDRTLKIASLPMMQMQGVLTDLNSESSGLSSLDAKVGNLQSAITTLSSALGLNSYSTSVSDSVVRATTSEGVREGVYSIEVTGL